MSTPTVPAIRIQASNDRPIRRDGAFVLYWCTAFRRTAANFAFQRAVELAVRLRRPLLFVEALGCGYPWASDRFHRFVIEGMAANASALEGTHVHYHPYVEPSLRAGRELVETLSRDACIVVADDSPDQTFTDTGASYMGFASSALLASALADRARYCIAVVGDGSFFMNPQILLDGVEHGVRGAIAVLDNRRMAAISGLQIAQYGRDFATSDRVPVDYVALARAVGGVYGLFGGFDRSSLETALETARAYDGLSLIHVPVYWGEDPRGDMGVYGRWNVGDWCDEVEERYHSQLL